MVRNGRARCASCISVQMVPGTLYVQVSGLRIPRGRRLAIQWNFYFFAHPGCLSRRPPFSSLLIPPPVINVSVNSFLESNDIAISRIAKTSKLLADGKRNFFRQWPCPKLKISKFRFEDSSNADRLISTFTHFNLLQVAILSWMTCLNLEHNVLILSNKEITIMYNYFACPFLNCNTINMRKICRL